VHHETAHDWFAEHRTNGWATCPITENGFVRILTHPRAVVEDDAQAVRGSLRKFCGSPGHVFWLDAVSLRDARVFDPSVIVTHRQLTDVYLLGLATKMNGTLATFDGRIPLKAVRGATTDNLTVIAAAG
jgi:toxin-antitoxin system PIN domain toxin